jgi:mannosyltransferase OCH1-like enzyme
MIPKTLHQIWVGSNPLPAQFEAWSEGWRTLHPEWNYRLWTDANMPPLLLQWLYDCSTNGGHRSDVARYELLYQFGGVYVDFDIECHQPIDRLVEGAVTGLIATHPTPEGHTWYENAFLAATPGHPFLARALQELPRHFRSHQSESPALRTGPAFIGELHKRYRAEAVRTLADDLMVLPPSYLMPHGWHERENPQRGLYGTHYWAGSWQGQPWEVNDGHP